MLGREANFLLKRLAQSISIKWDKPLGQTTGWLCPNLSFAILRATNLCLHGSRTKWRSGVGIDYRTGQPAELTKSIFLSFFCCIIFLFMFLVFSVLVVMVFHHICNIIYYNLGHLVIIVIIKIITIIMLSPITLLEVGVSTTQATGSRKHQANDPKYSELRSKMGMCLHGCRNLWGLGKRSHCYHLLSSLQNCHLHVLAKVHGTQRDLWPVEP